MSMGSCLISLLGITPSETELDLLLPYLVALKRLAGDISSLIRLTRGTLDSLNVSVCRQGCRDRKMVGKKQEQNENKWTVREGNKGKQIGTSKQQQRCWTRFFFSLGGLSSKNFAFPPPQPTAVPSFWPEPVPQLNLVLKNFKNFTSFLSQFWLLFSSKLHQKALFYALNTKIALILL